MYSHFFKRIFDFTVAGIALLFLLPLFLLIAVFIKLDSKGPVFFRQKRGGLGGEYFDIFKFRSMTVKEKTDGKDFDAGSCPRITRTGKIIRKTKIDELPQLINVVTGEMSLVGPRPEVETYIKLYQSRWDKILAVRPGITDPASIKFRNEEELLAKAANPEEEYRNAILPRKLQIYEDYVGRISFMNDVKILLGTIFVVLKG
ncbi:MAG: sugar transferase [Victivallales bacterium]|jgi:lipopolysaccharide/colanic/teichoic acid biosynthesis glycosyltransferase